MIKAGLGESRQAFLRLVVGPQKPPEIGVKTQFPSEPWEEDRDGSPAGKKVEQNT